MNNNTLFLKILPAILNETVQVRINPAAGYNSLEHFETYELLNKFHQEDSIATIFIMDLKPLYNELLEYLQEYLLKNETPEKPRADIYFEINETVTLLIKVRSFIYGQYDMALEGDVTSLLQDYLHGDITEGELEWLLRDPFPDYHGPNDPETLNPFYQTHD